MPQVKHRKVSAAEKRAELEARGEQPPVCDCHGEAKYWQSDQECSAGGYWKACAVRKREREREYQRRKRATDPEWVERKRERKREREREYNRLNPEKKAAQNARRIFVGAVYSCYV